MWEEEAANVAEDFEGGYEEDQDEEGASDWRGAGAAAGRKLSGGVRLVRVRNNVVEAKNKAQSNQKRPTVANEDVDSTSERQDGSSSASPDIGISPGRLFSPSPPPPLPEPQLEPSPNLSPKSTLHVALGHINAPVANSRNSGSYGGGAPSFRPGPGPGPGPWLGPLPQPFQLVSGGNIMMFPNRVRRAMIIRQTTGRDRLRIGHPTAMRAWTVNSIPGPFAGRLVDGGRSRHAWQDHYVTASGEKAELRREERFERQQQKQQQRRAVLCSEVPDGSSNPPESTTMKRSGLADLADGPERISTREAQAIQRRQEPWRFSVDSFAAGVSDGEGGFRAVSHRIFVLGLLSPSSRHLRRVGLP